MKTSTQAGLESNLKLLRLPAMLSGYQETSEIARKSKFSYEEYLYTLSNKEQEARLNQRVISLLKQARFPKEKLLSDYDFSKINIKQEAINQLCHGYFIDDYTNIIFYGAPGSGKTHLASAIGRELCIKGKKVLFQTCCTLVQELVKAKNNVTLVNYFKRMMGYDLIILDELGYIPFERGEAELLFQFISDRYEKKPLLITTNLTFSEWDKVFKDPIITSAAIDRLIHYSQVFEFVKDVSYRTEVAKNRLKNKK